MSGNADPFAATDRLDDALLQVIATRLEARGKHPAFLKMMHEYLDVMQIDSLGTVLDLGCGTGVAAREIARREKFSGKITGIDLSPFFIRTAQQLATAEGMADCIEFRAGDTRSLALENASFDAVVAHTLVSHVDDPLAVIKEAARVMRPGGLLGIFDGDYASLAFGYPDPVQGKTYDEALINAVVTSPRVMRQMPRLLQTAGLVLVASFPYVLAELGTADFWLNWIQSFRKIIPNSGVMTEKQANEWADALINDSKAGVFFGVSNYYSYIALRPIDQ